MGQKITPISNRLIISKDWQSKWFGRKKDYAKFLHQDIKLREKIKKEFKFAGIEKVIVERDTGETIIKIYSSRPGLLIGRSGTGANKLSEELAKIAERKVNLKIIEVKKPDLSSVLQAENIAYQLEKRINFRRAATMVLEKIKEAGAKGAKIKLSGRLGGLDIARTETFSFGSVPLSSLRKKIDFGKALARTKYGVIGIKVWVYKG